MSKSKSIYGWMTFQILIGIWLFISPFVFGYRDMMGASTNNMIFGALTVLLGVGVTLYEYYVSEAAESPGLEHLEHQESA